VIARPHRPRTLGVVTRRAHRGKGDRGLAGHKRTNHRTRAAARVVRGHEAWPTNVSASIGPPPDAQSSSMRIDHHGVVDSFQLAAGRHGRLAPCPAKPVLSTERRFDCKDPLRRVRMLGEVLARVMLTR
jgi:hypothetical protein